MSAIGSSRHFTVSLNLVAFGGTADIGCSWDWMRSVANDPLRTFQLFGRHPPRCISVGADLAPNDVDVTAQIIQLVGKG